MTTPQLTPKGALQVAVDATPGGQAGLAKALGFTSKSPRGVVWAWLERGRAPTEWCPAIERLLVGTVTCESLRPDVTWARVPDPEWPHSKGRPCIDVASPEAA